MRKQYSSFLIGKILLLFICCIFSICCKETESTQTQIKPICEKDAVLLLSLLKTITIPADSSIGIGNINCPEFIYWERPYHIGDTLAVLVSQNYGSQIIGNKPVYVTVSSSLGDKETYILKNQFWPCEIRAVDVVVYRAIIFYNSVQLGDTSHAFPNNGQLEIRTTGDTLNASFISYCTGDTIRDRVVILPK